MQYESRYVKESIYQVQNVYKDVFYAMNIIWE